MKVLLILMLISLLLPIVQSFRSSAIWERILCYTTISTRIAVVLIILSQFRHDAMIAMVAAVVLILGNSGLLLLANLLKGLESECD